MNRYLIFAVAASLVALPTVAFAKRPEPATEVEKAKARQEYFSCVAAHVPTLDDGVSDAQTVGKAAASQCRSELSATVEVLGRDGSPRMRRMLFDMLIDKEGENGAEAVLRYRTLKKP